MATVHHPAFPEITHEVHGAKLDEHLRCGWILIPGEEEPRDVESDDDDNTPEPKANVTILEPASGLGDEFSIGWFRRR
jgi:hypothetical protein